MLEIRDAAIWDGYYSASPILSLVAVRPQREGRQSSFEDEQGNIRQVNYQSTRVDSQQRLKYACGLEYQAYVKLSNDLGRSMGKATAQRIYESVEAAARQAGNLVNMEGREFTQAVFLETLERVVFDFAPDGSPLFPSLTMGSEAQARFHEAWPLWISQPEFKIRFKTLIERKREEFHEREACRRLVD